MRTLRWFGDAAAAAAFTRWRSEGTACAIATVVATRSSAPRPVGSKLVICEDGKMAGSVSGGCVENAVALEARTVIDSGEPILLHYGFTADQAFEVGLPCGGEIDVFLEPGPTDDSPEADIASDGTVLLTLLDGPQIGHKLLVRPGVGAVGGNASQAIHQGQLALDSQQAQAAALVVLSGEPGIQVQADATSTQVHVQVTRRFPTILLRLVGLSDLTVSAQANAACACRISGWRVVTGLRR
jgi:xanthine dehydrogenase accessory factor